jgi:hypothetical protein
MTFLASGPHLRGVARIVGYASVALLVLSAAIARAGYESVADRQLRAGADFNSLPAGIGGTMTVVLNGAPVNVSAALTDQSPAQVIDRYEALCESSVQLTASAMGNIAKTLREGPAPGVAIAKLAHGVVRKDGDGASALTCFAGDRAFSLSDLPARLRAFTSSGDLSAFGKFRYVYAKALRHGTFVRTAWADGALNLEEMFPEKGDAPGDDSPIAPRPPGSRRVFSVASAQVPDTVEVYEAREPEQAVRAYYDREMSARRWKAFPHDDAGTAVYRDPGGALVYCTFGSRDGTTTVTTTVLQGASTPSLAGSHQEL